MNKEKQTDWKRERRNGYGENDKASRKGIPRFKKLTNRRERQTLNHQFQVEGGVDGAVARKKVQRRKVPDWPLERWRRHKVFKEISSLIFAAKIGEQEISIFIESVKQGSELHPMEAEAFHRFIKGNFVANGFYRFGEELGIDQLLRLRDRLKHFTTEEPRKGNI